MSIGESVGGEAAHRHEIEAPTAHRRRALLPLAAAALCASVLVFVHVQQDQAPAGLSTERARGSASGLATSATKKHSPEKHATNTQRDNQRLNAAAARAALAQKRVAEKAVTAALAVTEAGSVGKAEGGGKVPAHCLRCLPHPCNCAQPTRSERTWPAEPALEQSGTSLRAFPTARTAVSTPVLQPYWATGVPRRFPTVKLNPVT